MFLDSLSFVYRLWWRRCPAAVLILPDAVFGAVFGLNVSSIFTNILAVR